MDVFLAIYWPPIVAGFAIGIVAGIVAFRPRPKNKNKD